MEEKKKGIGLIGMVISSCIGSGVFAITGQLAGDGEHARADARADHHTDEPNAFLFLFHTSIPSLAGLVPTSALCARCPQIRAAPWRRGPALETALLTSRLAKTNAPSSHGGGTRTVRMTHERSSLSPARTTMKEVN